MQLKLRQLTAESLVRDEPVHLRQRGGLGDGFASGLLVQREVLLRKMQCRHDLVDVDGLGEDPAGAGAEKSGLLRVAAEKIDLRAGMHAFNQMSERGAARLVRLQVREHEIQPPGLLGNLQALVI